MNDCTVSLRLFTLLKTDPLLLPLTYYIVKTDKHHNRYSLVQFYRIGK